MNPTPALAEALAEQARNRADALSRKEEAALRALLSPEFRYTDPQGKTFDRESYVAAFLTDGSVRWVEQRLEIEATFSFWNGAIAIGTVFEVIDRGGQRVEARYRTTQAYAWSEAGWVYLVGHTSAIRS